MKEKGKIDVFITILLIYIFFLLNSSFPQTFWKYNCNVNSLYCYCCFFETTNHIIRPTSLKTIGSVTMFWKTNFLAIVSCFMFEGVPYVTISMVSVFRNTVLFVTLSQPQKLENFLVRNPKAYEQHY